ncbi:MAG: EthD family reductase [Nitriliruptorales bacterium]
MGGAAYLVLYEGRPADPDAFLDYYAGEHVPLLWRFPGIRCVEIDLGRDDGGFFMVVRLLFESLDDLRTAITSPEREDARADMSENFPEFEGRVRHQVVELTTVSPDGEMRPPLRA